MNIISLGAGVQSSTMALMAAHGEIGPMPDCAIFADTQDEPAEVYTWLKYLTDHLPFPVHIVTKGSLSEKATTIIKSKKSGKLYMKGMIPAFVLAVDGTKGLLGRTCTSDYKIAPVHAKIRELANIKRGEKEVKVHEWMGISIDEAHRMKPSQESWIKKTYPLIEHGFTRQHCLEWMAEHNYLQPPRSACRYCPFHSNKEWVRSKIDHPEEFAKSVAFEKKMQEAARNQEVLRGIPFLHSSCKPLDEINFAALVDTTIDMFGNECEGMCGV
jgi:hypothetical protein